MRKIFLYIVLATSLCLAGYFAFIYYVQFSEGVRSGELIKISHKGFLIKTWEGEMSQGISGAQIFSFSVMDNEEETIQTLKDLQGKYVKIEYEERYKTFFWWGVTRYFVTKVIQEESPHFRN